MLIRFLSYVPVNVILLIFLASRLSRFVAHWREAMSESALGKTSSRGAFRLTQQCRAAQSIKLGRPSPFNIGQSRATNKYDDESQNIAQSYSICLLALRSHCLHVPPSFFVDVSANT